MRIRIDLSARNRNADFREARQNLVVTGVAGEMWPIGESALKSGHFNYIGHTNSRRKYFDRGTDFSLLRRYYLDLPDKKAEIESVYYKIFQKRFPKLWAWIYGQYYRLKFHYNRIKNKC